MTPWEQAVADQLARYGAVTLDAVGGVPAISDDAVTSPLFPDVADAVIATFATLSDDDQETAVRLLCSAVATVTSGLALRLVCDLVVPAAAEVGAIDTLKDLLRQRVTDRSDEARSTIASIALKALCHLALLEPQARFVLFDALSGAGTSPEDEEFAMAASWVAGVVFDRWREPAAAECLERLTTGEGEADASFWLGQAHLVTALELNDTDDIRTAMRGTLEHFDRAVAMGEERPDAVLYAATVRFITDYGVGADPARLAQHLNRATTACHQYLIDGIGVADLPAWMRPRYDAEVRWVELLKQLQTATDAEDRDAWFEAPRMIDGLADAYTAAHTLTPTRSYLSPDSGTTGVVETVVPRIASAFIDDIVPLAYLDQWLARSNHPDAPAFREAIDLTVAERVTRGKAPAAGDYPAVIRYLGAIPDSDDTDYLAQIEHVLEDLEADKIARTERVVTELLNSLYDGLVQCPDFTGDVRTCFTIVIDQVIRFLQLRMNAQQNTFGKRFAYLYDPNAHEEMMGLDLREFISGNVAGVINCEVQQVAGGRTDLIVQFDGFKITIELKREQSDASRDRLAKYLPQLAAYESTDVALGMLIVLDLTAKPTGAPNIRDNAWVARLDGPNPGDRDRYAVVVRVPGNRRAPSAL